MKFDTKGRRLEASAVTLVYAALLAFVAAHHEPWFDEAQAWLLARDSTLWELLLHQVRYEGSPALWHLLLLIPTRLGLPYRAITYFGAFPAIAGVWIWARYSPFPRLLRLTMPFTLFLFYQYAVVARSYNLIPPLLFGLAAMDRQVRHRPLAYAALLALLANTCLPGTLIAGALLLIQIRKVSPAGVSLSVLGIALAIATAFPPSDVSFARGSSPNLTAVLAGSGQMLSDSFTEILPLSYAILGISLWWFVKRRVLSIYALPTALLLLLFVVKFHNPWHEGLLWLVWLFALWLSFEEPLGRDGRRLAVSSLERRLCLASIAVVAAVHLLWGARTSIEDVRRPYSGSAAAAEFLRDRTGSTISAVGFHSIGILPYFERNIFDNFHARRPPSYWLWSTHNDLRSSPEQILADRPDYVVYGIKRWISDGQAFDPDPKYLLGDYRNVAEFPGGLFWKGRVAESDSFEIYQRRDLAPDVR